MLISRGAVSEYLSRDFRNFAWMKKLTRDQLMRELNALRVRPRFKTEPWLHQLVCFYIGLMYPRFLYLLDMGLGKSKILADLITHTQRERKLEGALITVPRLINIDSWTDDLALHSNLEPWTIGSSEIEEKTERLLMPRGDVTLIDYPGLCLALCKKVKKKGRWQYVRDDKRVVQLCKEYNWLGIDESHKLSSHDNTWFGIMRQITKRMEFVYASTGTLFGKEVEDLWAQFYLVDQGETFGENLGLFRASFFDTKADPWRGEVRTFNPAMERKLHYMIGNRSLRYDEDEVLDLPPQVPRVKSYMMGDEQREHYLRALEGLINADGKLRDLDGAWTRMRQIISGYLAWKDEHGSHVLHFKDNPKLDGLQTLVEEMGDNKMVVVYHYTETGRMICERLKTMGVGHEWYYGGTKDQSASRRRFLDDRSCRVFVMNDEAGGTGNDGLQKVARYMAMYETPTSPTTRRQTAKRIHRPGKTSRSFLYDLVMRNTLDKKILDDIKMNVDTHDAVVNGRKLRREDYLS